MDKGLIIFIIIEIIFFIGFAKFAFFVLNFNEEDYERYKNKR